MIQKISQIIEIPELRKRLLYVVYILCLYRVGSHIPISGLDMNALQALFSQGGVLGFFNLFSGGGLERFSIFALGILPYINASIIMQLLTVISPQLKELAQEGESGRKQLSQYTRYFAVVLSVVQAIVMTIGFKGFLLPGASFSFFLLYAVVSLVAGATLVMWFGELMTEHGIGNGASLLIFLGIIAQMPSYIKNTYILYQGGTSLLNILVLVAVILLMILSIIYIQEAERKVPVQYAKRVIGRKMVGAQKTYIPLRLIQGGVMPIIFASAILQFPLILTQFINVPSIQNFFGTYYQYDGVAYNLFFCILIFFFAYFYTAITFNPNDISDNIKKNGGFIMGVRPGSPTVDFLEGILTKLTFIGASFLAIIALTPVVAANMTNVNSFMGLGGTAILIIVGVAMDLVKQIEVFVLAQRYEGVLE